jgi:hypothetical protein
MFKGVVAGATAYSAPLTECHETAWLCARPRVLPAATPSEDVGIQAKMSAPAAMPRRGRLNPKRGISVSSR